MTEYITVMIDPKIFNIRSFFIELIVIEIKTRSVPTYPKISTYRFILALLFYKSYAREL